MLVQGQQKVLCRRDHFWHAQPRVEKKKEFYAKQVTAKALRVDTTNKILKIINDWLTNLYDYTSIFRSLAKPSSLNVMSVRFSADSIVAPSSITNARTQHTAMMNGQSNFNSMSSKMETHSLMDTQQHQGRLGTPDANNASYMSSDYQNNHQQHQEEQHLNKPNITSPAAAFVPSAQDLFSQLHEALALEPKYQPNLFLPLQSNVSFFPLRPSS